MDGNWTTDHTAPQETDKANHTNNVLMPKDIEQKSSADVSEEQGSSGLPGAFPETPAAQEFRINPIPATPGIGNPVQLRPGEPVPPASTFTNRTVDDTATYDKESYEKSGAAAAPQLPNPVTPDEERAANGGMFGLTDEKKNVIPESSLPMGADAGAAAAEAVSNSGPTIQSSGPQSTTAQLAGQVPLEPKRAPEVVKESQDAASASPEASTNPEALQSKSAVEEELSKTVPEQPATSESTVTGKAAGLAAGAAAGATAAITAGAAHVGSSTTAQNAKSKLPVPAQETLDKVANGAANGSAKDATPIASSVPDPVQESIAEAQQSPEAAANKEAVQEKSQVESELLKKVEPDDSAGEPAPTASAATATTAPAPLKSTEEPLTESKPVAAAAEKDMAASAGATTASAAEPSTKEGLAAPAAAPAKTPATEELIKPRLDSRDISPMSHPVKDVSEPLVTSGVSSSATPKKSTPAAGASSSTPATNSPMSAKTGDSTPGTDKKDKRRSFFGRIKDKLEHKKDKA